MNTNKTTSSGSPNTQSPFEKQEVKDIQPRQSFLTLMIKSNNSANFQQPHNSGHKKSYP